MSRALLKQRSQAINALQRQHEHGVGFHVDSMGQLALFTVCRSDGGPVRREKRPFDMQLCEDDEPSVAETILSSICEGFPGSKTAFSSPHPLITGLGAVRIHVSFTEWNMIPDIINTTLRLFPPGEISLYLELGPAFPVSFKSTGLTHSVSILGDINQFSWMNVEHRLFAWIVKNVLAETDDTAPLAKRYMEFFELHGSPRKWTNQHLFMMGTSKKQTNSFLFVSGRHVSHPVCFTQREIEACKAFKILSFGNWPYPEIH